MTTAADHATTSPRSPERGGKATTSEGTASAGQTPASTTAATQRKEPTKRPILSLPRTAHRALAPDKTHA